MKPLILLFVLLASTAVHAQQTPYANHIGLFSTSQPAFAFPDYPGGISFETIIWACDPGFYETYLFCREPMNLDTGTRIDNLGGFELDISLPDDWFVQEVALPPGVMDFDAAGTSFYCAGRIPVDDVGEIPAALLATVTLGTYLENPPVGCIYVAPYFAAPSLPGQMAITDADDAFSLHPAFPRSGGYDLFVMTVNAHVDPVEDLAWGDVKALYR